MKQVKLKQLIRKMYMPRLIIPVVLFIALMTVMIINPFKSHLTPVNVKDISTIEKLFKSGKDDIIYTADKLYYSGINYSVGNHTRGAIYYTLEKDRCYYFIICIKDDLHIHPTLNNHTVRGHLTNNSMYETILSSMSEKLEFSKDNLRAMSSPIIVDEYDYKYNITNFAIWSIRIFSIMVIIDIIFISFVFFNPQISIPFFKMRKYGRLKDIYRNAEEEFDNYAVKYGNKVYLTDNYIFGINGKHNLEIARFENVVWMYKEKELIVINGNAEVLSSLCIVTDQKQIIKIYRVADDILKQIIPIILKKHPEIMYSTEN